VAQAASGFLGLLINPENPRVVGPALADSITGFYAAYGVLGALFERARTGVGRKVEVSMLEAMTHFNLDAFTHYYSVGEIMGPYSRPSVSQSYVMQCADGKWLALHMSSPEKFWQGLARAIEHDTLLQDPRFANREGRIANQEALISILSPIFAKHPRAEWCRRLEAEDVPHAPMYDTSEALEDPQAKHLGILVSAQHKTMGEIRTVRPPVSFDGERSTAVLPPPVVGEHNDETVGALRSRDGETKTACDRLFLSMANAAPRCCRRRCWGNTTTRFSARCEAGMAKHKRRERAVSSLANCSKYGIK